MTIAPETGSAAAWRREAAEARKRAGDAEERAARADATIARLQDSLAEAIKAHHAVVAERDELDRALRALMADVEARLASDGDVQTLASVAPRIGDPVRVTSPRSQYAGLVGEVTHVDVGPFTHRVRFAGEPMTPEAWFRTDAIERVEPIADVVAQARALDEADRFGCGVEDDGAITLHPPIAGEAGR